MIRCSARAVALAVLLSVAVGTPAIARSGSGARGGHSHARPGGAAPHRHFASRPRFGYFIAAPLFASPFFYRPLAPMPPIEYIEMTPESSLFYCPESGGHYPVLMQCPGGWQWVEPAMPSPAPEPAWQSPAGAPDPAHARY